jgi:hypothetical protein
MLKTLGQATSTQNVSSYVLGIRDELISGSLAHLADISFGDLSLELAQGRDSIWALFRREGAGGIAVRTAFVSGGGLSCKVLRPGPTEAVRLSLKSPIGQHVIVLHKVDTGLQRVRITVKLTPVAPISIQFAPRDVYPFDETLDPLGVEGKVEAAQRGLNSGLVYFRMDEPNFGSVLYLQNLTALNSYYQATQTKPDGAVGGEWPELGYLPPMESKDGKIHSLPAGEEIVLSDAIVVVKQCDKPTEADSARHFIQMLAAAYTAMELPDTAYRDWVERAERTLKDLEKSPKATLKKFGAVYARPYTDDEYPDSMVQMSLLTAMHNYGVWRGEPHPLEAPFRKGLSQFYDPKLKCIRRYLPDVGADKDADAVDSWYLYHPLLNLAYLALDGDKQAVNLFLRSVDFGIKAAHHFKYRWPIQYNVRDFSVITAVAPSDGRGQTDVGGIYSQLMLLAYQLTLEQRFLEEAKAAIDAAIGLRFNLNYQANLTAWGAAACMRLWRITSDERYLQQSYVYLASFFHNCEIWESEIDNAAHYRNFLGVTCLQDAPYMAIYECFDSFAAFECYLKDGGPDMDPAVRLLVGEYCKYALDRAWYYYPDALPKSVLATEQRNGHIDRNLSFPLEDLYPDGQPAGQVGQEIYGAGAAWIFASRAFHHAFDAPFRIHCDHFIFSLERQGDTALGIQLTGDGRGRASLNFIRLKRKSLPDFTLRTLAGDRVEPTLILKDRIQFEVPANAHVVLSWK